MDRLGGPRGTGRQGDPRSLRGSLLPVYTRQRRNPRPSAPPPEPSTPPTASRRPAHRIAARAIVSDDTLNGGRSSCCQTRKSVRRKRRLSRRAASQVDGPSLWHRFSVTSSTNGCGQPKGAAMPTTSHRRARSSRPRSVKPSTGGETTAVPAPHSIRHASEINPKRTHPWPPVREPLHPGMDHRKVAPGSGSTSRD
jgi:hypothetical protein